MAHPCVSATPYRLLVYLVGFALTVAQVGAQGAELEGQRDGVIEAVSYATPNFSEASTSDPIWQTEIEKIGSQYVRLRITAEGVAEGGASLRLRDRNGRLVREYSESELLDRGTFWSPVVPGDYVLVSLHAAKPPVGFRVAIGQVAYQAYGGAPLSTVGEDEKEPIANYADDPTISRIEHSVARLLFIADAIPRTCTGFLINSGELMTNHHCVKTQDVCGTALAIFGYQHDRNGHLHFGEQFECAKFQEEKSSFELDYAILQLRGSPAERWGKLTLSAADPDTESGIFMVQHPAGEPKKISRRGCRASAVPVDGRSSETDFAHLCDTTGGSSGSPIFNAAGDVIGLHHYGFNEEGGAWTENRAIRMKRIVDDLDGR